jgi:hypothetical protein
MLRRLLLTLPVLFLLLPFSACGGGGTPTTPRTGTVAVSISPSSASVGAGQSEFFVARVTGTTNPVVTWAVNGVAGGNTSLGTVNAGNYIAPSTIPSPATVTITATSAADTTKVGKATVTVTVGVSITPSRATVNLGDVELFTATVIGSSNTGVDWAVNGIVGGNATIGTINSGIYTAPNAIPDPPGVSVNAISQADPTQSAVANCTIQAGGAGVNQAAQAGAIQLGTSGGNNFDSSGNFCCSGTLGALLSRGGNQYILSNNHVLANSDKGTVGDPIGQPGLVDSNCSPGRVVANLSQYVKLEGTKIGTTGSPSHPLYSAAADAAMAQVVSGQVDSAGAVLQLGAVVGGLAQAAPPGNTTVAPALGMPVAKSGRTTGLTCSAIGTDPNSSISLTVQVDYPPSCGSAATAFTVQYSNQIDIVSDTFSNAGDSGSLIVNSQTAEPVGLLYAGSNTDTVANPISDVLAGLADSKGVQPMIVGVATTHTVGACTGNSSSSAAALQAATITKISDTEMARAITAKQNHVDALMSDPAVFGVGIGTGDTPGTTAIVILVEQGKTPRPIPAQLDGVKTRVRYTQRFRAYDSCPQTRSETGRLLPSL